MGNHSRQLHPQLVLAQKGGSSTQGKEILFTQTRSSQQSRASATSSYPISAHFHTARHGPTRASENTTVSKDQGRATTRANPRWVPRSPDRTKQELGRPSG